MGRDIIYFLKNKKVFLFLVVFLFIFFIFNLIFLKNFVLRLISLFIFLIIAFVLYFAIKEITFGFKKNENIDTYFQSLIETLNQPLIGYGQDFKIIYFNKEAENFFNLKKDEILNKTITPELLSDKKIKPLVQVIYPSLASVVLYVSEPNIWPVVNEIVLAEPKRYLKTYTIKLLNKDGSFFCFLKIIQDKTREQELINLKNDFISAAAHQTRTPLSAISWAFETLINLNKDESLNEIIKNGYEATQRALKIVNDLLNVSKIEEGKFDYNFQEVELNQFIKKILLIFKDLAKEYDVELYFNPLEEVKVKIDEDKFGLAISNFIDNAIRYNIRNGKVEVNVEKVSDKPYVLISIKDTGIGIPEEKLKYVSQKFYRIENAVQKEPNGSGLGVYIAKNIIEKHGGKLSISSILNRGTTVNIFLPTDFSLISKNELNKQGLF